MPPVPCAERALRRAGTRPSRPTRATRRAVAVLVSIAVGFVVTPVVGAPPAAATTGPVRADRERHRPAEPGPTVLHTPPVAAPIADPFRPPAGPYGAGNRGLEYDTAVGDPVRASAAGTVVFAGPVAGALHVTIEHGDGVRTSYSFLHTVDATVGTPVSAGAVVGTAGERLHFGARVGDAYFDPAMLFLVTASVELLPYEVPPGSAPDGEARALFDLALAEGDGVSLGGVAPALRWLRQRAGDGFEVLAPVIGSAGAGSVGRGLDVAGDLADRLLFPPPCSPEPPPARPAATGAAGTRGGSGATPGRVAVTVAGLGSTSDAAAIDELRTGELGYDEGRVVRFSYRGGRTPGTGTAVDLPVATAYASADTQGDAAIAGRRLADLVESVAAGQPRATIDLYAHSLGGLVARLALLELDRRGFDLDRLGVVVTLASPHDGADLATAISRAADAPRAGPALDVVAEAFDLGLDPDAPVVDQLSEGSPLVRRLSDGGVPAGVRVLSISARGDLVVPAPRTTVDGARAVTVPSLGVGAHSDVVGADATTAEIARALAGMPPGCEAWHDVVADVLVGHAISAIEDDLGLALVAAG